METETDANANPNSKSEANTASKATINVWQFLQMYKIGGVPIVNFVVAYAIVYLANKLFFSYNYRVLLLVTIAIVLCVALVFGDVSNPVIALIIVVACVVVLIVSLL